MGATPLSRRPKLTTRSVRMLTDADIPTVILFIFFGRRVKNPTVGFFRKREGGKEETRERGDGRRRRGGGEGQGREQQQRQRRPRTPDPKSY